MGITFTPLLNHVKFTYSLNTDKISSYWGRHPQRYWSAFSVIVQHRALFLVQARVHFSSAYGVVYIVYITKMKEKKTTKYPVSKNIYYNMGLWLCHNSMNLALYFLSYYILYQNLKVFLVLHFTDMVQHPCKTDLSFYTSDSYMSLLENIHDWMSNDRLISNLLFFSGKDTAWHITRKESTGCNTTGAIFLFFLWWKGMYFECQWQTLEWISIYSFLLYTQAEHIFI